MWDYKICCGVRLHITGLDLVGGCPIKIKLWSGMTFRMQILLSEDIRQVKAMIQKEVSIDPDKQCLTFDGRQLENDKTLWNYGI